MFPHPPNLIPRAAIVHYSFCMKRQGIYCTFLGFFTMHYFISTELSITLFGFLSSLAFNNRIENLTLITKFRWAPPLFSGDPEAVPVLPAGRAGPGDELQKHSRHNRLAF